MTYTCLISVLVSTLIVLSPLRSSADYLIDLKNGRQIVTTRYWHDEGDVVFEMGGDFASIKAGAVVSITARDTGNVIERPSGDGRKTPEKGPAGLTPHEGKENELAAYKQKKDEVIAQIDGTLEKYREALSSQDNEGRDRLHREITALSKQVFDLTDEVKRKNHGHLPEGWQQY